MVAERLKRVRNGLHRVACEVVLNDLAGHPLVPMRVRSGIYRAMGIPLGRHVLVFPRCVLTGRRLRIGTRSFVNTRCFFDCREQVTLGDWVYVGMDVLFCTSTHEQGPPGRRAGIQVHRPIAVGDGCWIGARATVLPGVTIGPGCVIAAGAVVTADCAPDGFYGGVPARRIRDLPMTATGGSPSVSSP